MLHERILAVWRSVFRWALIAAPVGLLAACCVPRAIGGEVTLKSGFVISGTPRRLQALTVDPARMPKNDPPTYPYLLIENGYQRIFLAKKQAKEVVERDDLGKFETFLLKQRKTGAKQIPASLGPTTTAFNEFGQRSHSLGPRDLVVGVTKITPKYVGVTGINCQWDYGLATTSVPPAQLDAMIRKVNDPKNPDHRFSIARFYLQAAMYEESGKELDAIAKDFPELSSRVADARKELKDYEHRLIVQELNRRKAAGQHELAFTYAQLVPQAEASANVLNDVRQLIRDHDSARERIARVRVLLADLQAKLGDSQLMSAVMPLRSTIDEQLTIESLERLQAFFNLVDDTTLGPSEKLALAYSGWVAGSAGAVTDLHLAVRLWDAQRDILEFLRAATPQERKELRRKVEALDGVTPDVVLKLLRNLPPVIETADVRPGVAATIPLGDGSAEPSAGYGVLLPPEYDWRHQYPLIVALHPADRPAKAELDWWGGTQEKPGLAQRQGYIVIAPEYMEAGARKYNYSIAAHDAVLRAMNDARRRFNVDSDRIFLSGHGMGGDAAFDIGMSHPDLFAGVMPITGICDQFCRWYWQNAGHTAWYVVTGEFEGDAFKTNATTLGRMMQKGTDLVWVEFIQRGKESFFEESPRLFEWMETHRRQKAPRDFEMRVLRATENHFYWLQADDLPASVLQPTVLAGEARGPIRPMLLGGKILPGNVIYVTSAAKSHTVWLAPELANYTLPLTIRIRGQQKYRHIPQPSIEAILDDFRLRADRQLIYNVRIDVH